MCVLVIYYCITRLSGLKVIFHEPLAWLDSPGWFCSTWYQLGLQTSVALTGLGHSVWVKWINFSVVHTDRQSTTLLSAPSPLLSFVLPVLGLKLETWLSLYCPESYFVWTLDYSFHNFISFVSTLPSAFALLEICWNSPSAEGLHLVLEDFYPLLSFEWGSIKRGDKVKPQSRTADQLMLRSVKVIQRDVFHLSPGSAMNWFLTPLNYVDNQVCNMMLQDPFYSLDALSLVRVADSILVSTFALTYVHYICPTSPRFWHSYTIFFPFWLFE